MRLAIEVTGELDLIMLAVDLLRDPDGRLHIIELVPFIGVHSPEQLHVDGRLGVYLFDSGGNFTFREGRYWIQKVNFSDPYFSAGQVIIVKAENTSIENPADLAGKRVGVCLGTTGDIVTTNMEGVIVARYDKTTEALLDLKNGGVDAVVADSVILRWEAAKDRRLKLVDRKPFTVEFYGICVRKGDDKLLADVNQALAEIKASGEYARIFAKWFGQ